LVDPTLRKKREGWGTRRLVARGTAVKEDGCAAPWGAFYA
jgi:hypothetical protein